MMEGNKEEGLFAGVIFQFLEGDVFLCFIENLNIRTKRGNITERILEAGTNFLTELGCR